MNGKRVRAGTRLAPGDRVRVPPLPDRNEGQERRRPAPPIDEADAAMMQAAVIYRDADMIALNKPPGLPVQGGSHVARHLDGSARSVSTRPRRPAVHRLDRDTSGVLLLARHAAAARDLTALFRSRELRKLYWGLVVGVPKPPQGRIDAPLAKRQVGAGERVVATVQGGQRAITDYALIEPGDVALMARRLTAHGRTQQLRAHTASVSPPRRGRRQYAARRRSPAASSRACTSRPRGYCRGRARGRWS